MNRIFALSRFGKSSGFKKGNGKISKKNHFSPESRIVFSKCTFLKKFYLIAMIAIIPIIATTMTACPTGAEEDKEPSPHLGIITLEHTNEQVWVPNRLTGLISNLLQRFSSDRQIKVSVIEFLDDDDELFNLIQVGSGSIENGIMNFSVSAGEMEKNLMDGNEFIARYFKDWSGASTFEMKPAKAKGNIITVIADGNEGLVREGFSGTNSSLSAEYIYYAYVDMACTITATSVTNAKYNHTFNSFRLNLQPGWNTICKKEMYTIQGHSIHSIQLKNVGFRWVMQPIKTGF